MNEQYSDGEVQKIQKKPFYKKWWFITIAVVVGLLIISSFGEDKEKKEAQTKTDNQTSEQANADNKSEKNDSTPLLGDEFILKYDEETNEKIFIVDTEENYIAFVKSSVMKDTEGSIEISKKHVISIDNGTKVRVIDYVKSDEGIAYKGIKVRVLEGDKYNSTGYVTIPFLKKIN